jgi:tetratricopeptide (TPR) repeat protein
MSERSGSPLAPYESVDLLKGFARLVDNEAAMDPHPESKPQKLSFTLSPAPFGAAIEGAARALERRTKDTPAYPDLWNRMGLYFAAIGALDEAGGCFERALAINPRFLGALENRAWTAVAAGDADAWQRFASGELVRLHPGVRHHLLLFATARFEAPERALFMTSMPPQGRYEAAHFLDRLWLLTALGRTHEAEYLVGDTCRSDPALRGAFATAGLPGAAEGADPVAWEAWRAAYSFNPQLADVCAHTARWCQTDGELNDSRALVDWALALSLDLPSFWVNLALHHDAAGESSRSLPCLERAVASNPQHRRARKELALWLAGHGQSREAIVQFEILKEVAPNYADVRFHLGLLYHERGDLERAGVDLTAALAANPRFTRAALNLARVRFEQGRWAEAKAGFERVIADGAGDCATWIALAESHDRLEERAEAEACFARAEAFDATDTQLYRARADWFDRLGRNDEARADRARLDDLLRQHPLEEAA